MVIKEPAYELVDATRLDGSTSYEPSRETRGAIRPWKTGFWTRFPYTGILSIFLSFSCGIVACVLALISDGKPLDYWKIGDFSIQPSVLLAILATICNAFLAYAFARGITIHWWVQAFRGTSLSQLHSSYALNPQIHSVFFLRNLITPTAFATILMVLVLIDSPLLQRASTVETMSSFLRTNSAVPISASPFMLGATGIIPDHNDYLAPNLYTPLYAEVLQSYNARNPIQVPGISCNGTCTADVEAPGWAIECTQSDTPYRLISYEETQEYYASARNSSTAKYKGPAPWQAMFQVNVTYNYTSSTGETAMEFGGSNYFIELSSSYKKTNGGNGTMGHTNCKLREAIVTYPVRFANSSATLLQAPTTSGREGKLIYRNLELEGQGDYPSTLGGFWLALSTQFTTVANVSWVGGWAVVETTTPTSSLYLRATNSSALLTYDITWADPTNDIISMANELAFRTAVVTTSKIPGDPSLSGNYGLASRYNLTSDQPYIVSPNLTNVARKLTQQSSIQEIYEGPAYATHRGFLAGGLAVIALACLAILPLYWNFWTLGRPVSMSPLEIARAFEAPLMVHLDPNATADELRRAIGTEKVRFRPNVRGPPLT